MDVRGISTVVDATVFLLLVGGAIATVVAGTGGISGIEDRPTEPGNPASEQARLLATSTATVNYSLTPATGSPADGVTFHLTDGPGFERTAHGTLASLLAAAAVGNATLGDEQFTRVGNGFERGVAAAVRGRLNRRAVRTSVEASWKPYPGAPVAGVVRVGERPPRDVDVHAATTSVTSDIPGSRDRARRAAAVDGYHGVAEAVARSIVQGRFPPDETRLALRGDYPVDTLTIQRYRRTADVLGVRPAGGDGVNASESNERLATALTKRLETDLVERYDSPAAAARDVDTRSVEITVRTWSR